MIVEVLLKVLFEGASRGFLKVLLGLLLEVTPLSASQCELLSVLFKMLQNASLRCS